MSAPVLSSISTHPVSDPAATTPALSPASNRPVVAGLITPRALQAKVAEGRPCRIVDVRSPAEFEAVHVSGTEALPLDRLDAAAFAREHASRQGDVYILCQAGGRAQRAADKLAEAGVACAVVEGGLDAWVGAGLPVERANGGVLPLMRQVQIVIGVVSATGSALALWKNPLFALIPLGMGCGLIFAGVTGTCGLALLMARMPWNQRSRSPVAAASCCTPTGGAR